MDDRLAADLAAMWQSELAAMAADRELREMFSAMLALWARTAAMAMPAMTRADHELAPRGAGAAKPARTATSAAASHARDDEVEQLARRVAELERRLAGLERGDADPA
jgi:uncharacterized protein YceH (UPF0502 family)